MKIAGICLGASSVSIVELEKQNNEIKIIKSENRPHDGNAKGVLLDIFEKDNLSEFERIAVTGRKFRQFVNFSSISEPEAVEKAYSYVKEKYDKPEAIVSAGGETFMVYELDHKGKIMNVYTGNKCASGTGEFFLQQLKRMNLDVDQAINIAKKEKPYKVAGRCSVFCKSDCTHALNKGQPKGRVVAGLCQMMGNKILELLKRTKSENILLTGGTSNNSVMIDYLKEYKPKLKVSEEANYFEALGTALWAMENETKTLQNKEDLFKEGESSFGFLPSLKDHTNKVTFKEMETGEAENGDRCIIGLDVGSTTTKAILLRERDNAILGSIYLRTNGDPVGASKECYTSLAQQIKADVNIIGLGVTGSGRQIAGLHALTEGVINEIIAHAAAAVHFDSEVDTIFEIGGQDAKYTYITNKVPSDYAMNEACSAGTGSFLEESAKESMGVDTEEIADIALKSTKAPNFNDQCSAFISSDIKNAIQEGIKGEDIVAGLVYSICQNYANRVKGNRAVGKKVFMQGGVCYNKAVPIAMAAFTGNEIIVPPEPGLMGAYGVALEVKNKIELGIMKEQYFDLEELSKREAKYVSRFVCGGGKEKCDRGCSINMIEIKGKKYPFGGACNKYVNLLKNIEYDCEKLDLVALREKLAFEKYAPQERNNPQGKKIGISKSLMVNTLYPLYYNFFTSLGLNVELAENIDYEGMDRRGAAFCYPVELAHGYMGDMIKKELDYVFLPQIRGMYVENGTSSSVVCPLAQAEPYYLKTTFKELNEKKVLSPVLDFSKGYHTMTEEFVKIGKELGYGRKESIKAYKKAFEEQRHFQNELKDIGKEVIEEIENDPKRVGIVLFGRPYNAFTKDANMGIPHKFATRGYTVIPIDFLPYEKEESEDNMYWSMGQMILKAAKYVKRHESLYGTYITNFSCGPDSFLVGYFRNTMKEKPSLTLELDSHTADAGVDTRVEAFLDVVKSYIQLKNAMNYDYKEFTPAGTQFINGKLVVYDSNGKEYSLTDEHVHLIVPSMGDISSRAFVSALRYNNVNASAVTPPSDTELKMGRTYSSCKECLPFMLTVGSLMNYLKHRKNNNELLVYFMPQSSGPCRFGQYNVLMKNIISQNKIKDVALLSLLDTEGYAGLGIKFLSRAWKAIVIGDVLDEIYSAVLTLSVDKDYGIKVFNKVTSQILYAIENYKWSKIKETLEEGAFELSQIPLTHSIENAKKVALVGEIYVRRDGFSRQYLVEKLADKDIIVKVAPITEWIYYIDYRIKTKLEPKAKNIDIIKKPIESLVKRRDEKTIKNIMSFSGLYEYNLVRVNKIIKNVKHIVSPKLAGEAILTVGSALTEIIDEVSGVIAIGPFGCMPNRISEAIINESINSQKIKTTDDMSIVKKIMEEHPSLPFLAIETDGNAFPQVIQARLETFCLQVERLHHNAKNIW